MFNSKALKPKKFRWQYEDEDNNLLQNVTFFFLKYLVWPVKGFWRRTRERSKRAYEYARFGWHNYDWDFAYVYDLIEFKLKRLQKALKSGISIQEPEDTAALEELIQIVGRLRDADAYADKYLDQHDLKWGKMESRDEPWIVDGKHKGYTWITWRKNAPENAPKKTKQKERNEFRACYRAGERDRMVDLKRLHAILVKHDRKFWD